MTTSPDHSIHPDNTDHDFLDSQKASKQAMSKHSLLQKQLSKQSSKRLSKLLSNEIWTKPVLIVLGLLIVSSVLFMTIGANGNWDFVLGFRGKKLLALLIVGYALGVSTLLFQA